MELREPLLAIDDLTNSLRLQPNNARGYELRAAAFTAAERYAYAIADLDKAIKRNPSVAESFVERAHAFRQTGDLEKALEDCNHALDLDGKTSASTCAIRSR